MYKTLFLLMITAILMFGVSSIKAQNNSPQVKDKKLKIIKKPKPSTDGKCEDSEGMTTVRVTFDKSGKVTAAEIVKASTCYYFNRNALQKTREIKFEPQVENGESVTVTKIVVYQFTLL